MIVMYNSGLILSDAVRADEGRTAHNARACGLSAEAFGLACDEIEATWLRLEGSCEGLPGPAVERRMQWWLFMHRHINTSIGDLMWAYSREIQYKWCRV